MSRAVGVIADKCEQRVRRRELAAIDAQRIMRGWQVRNRIWKERDSMRVYVKVTARAPRSLAKEIVSSMSFKHSTTLKATIFRASWREWHMARLNLEGTCSTDDAERISSLLDRAHIRFKGKDDVCVFEGRYGNAALEDFYKL